MRSVVNGAFPRGAWERVVKAIGNDIDMEVDVSLQRKAHRKHSVPSPHRKTLRGAGSRFHLCRFEQMESRHLLSASIAPIHIATTYYEDSNNYDQPSVLQGTNTQVADLFEVSFSGGADGTNLTSMKLDLMNTFFNTENGAPGVYGSFPLTIISHDGFAITSSSVVNGGTQLALTFSGFQAGDKLVFSIDVDENGNLEANAVVEGAEIEGATLTGSFTAPHMHDVTTPGLVFYDKYSLAGTGLENALPNDDYDNAAALADMPVGSSPGPVYTAGAKGELTQTPLPITLSGTVYNDPDADNVRDAGEAGIAGVTLTLYELDGSVYVATGMTATTDANGNYSFKDLEPGTYRVVETQPTGYLSVGDTPGMVGGVTRGTAATVDILTGINLEGGDDSIHNDFAEVQPTSVSGYVYVDANNNGVFDAGEAPIGGVTVTLLDGSGNSTGKTAVTDSNGFYRFGGLMPGGYGVSEAQPDGYLDGLDAAGTAGGTAHNPGDRIDGIHLTGNQSGLNYDFGEIIPASLSGYVYVDANNNGVFDAGEAPIGGVLVTLLHGSGTPTGQTATTDSDGFYRFENLVPGVYGVSETQPEGYLDGLDAAGNAGGTAHNPGDRIDAVTLASGTKAKEYDFGELLPASISGRVFADLNGNNTLDSGEPLLSNVTIYLLDGAGHRIASTTTDGNGKYVFDNLTPGVYGVEEIQPSGYLEGGDQVGSAGGNLDGADRILKAQLDSGTKGISYDFWEVVPAKISGYVFQDGPTIVVKSGRSRAVHPGSARRQAHVGRQAAVGRHDGVVRRQRLSVERRAWQSHHHEDRRRRVLRVRHAAAGRVFDRGNSAERLYSGRRYPRH